MKTLILFLLSLIPFIIFAQDPLTINEAVRTFGKGDYPSYQVEIPLAKLKDTKKDWLKYLKTGTKNKPSDLADEVIMFGAVNRNVSPDTFNVYSTMLETDSNVKLTVWMTHDDSAYMSKSLNVDQDIAAKKYVRDFAVQEYHIAVTNELKQEKNKLQKVTDEYNKLIKQDEKASNKISQDQRDIGQNQTAMDNNQNDQKRKADQIFNQQTVVESSKSVSDDSYKAALKVLKVLQNDQKQLIKQYEKMGRQIDDWNTEIRNLQREIDQLRKDQQPKSMEVDQQKEVVNTVQKKLENIK